MAAWWTARTFNLPYHTWHTHTRCTQCAYGRASIAYLVHREHLRDGPLATYLREPVDERGVERYVGQLADYVRRVQDAIDLP